MKKIRKQAKLFIALTILLSGIMLYSCEQDVENQGIYMYSAQVVPEEAFTVSTTEKVSKNIIAAASSPVIGDVTVSFAIDKEAVETYNIIAGTAYKFLPDSYYSLSGNSSVIKSGVNTSEPVQLIVKPMPEDAEGIEKGVEYAVAVSITGVSGNIPILDASKTLIVAIQSPSYTNIDLANAKVEGVLVDGPAGGWTMTTNTTSKSNYNTGNLIDGKDGTPRFPIREHRGFPQIFTLDKQAVKTVKGFKLTPVYDYGAVSHNVHVMEMHSSNNGSSWKFQGTWYNDEIDPGTTEDNPDYKYLTFLVPVKARFFRFTITAGGGTEASLAEIRSIE